MTERTNFVPDHSGDNILPCDPLFTRLLTLAHRPIQRPAIRDLNTGVEKTAAQLLSDILNLRRVTKRSIHQSALANLENGSEVFITVLAPGGYEFTVGMLAVLALGAVASTISVMQPVGEAIYYVQKARSIAVLVATSAMELGEALATRARESSDPDFACIPICDFRSLPDFNVKDIFISSNKYLDPNSGGIVIFTSGTTGPPKGAVLRRAAVSDGAMSFAEQLRLQETDVLLHLLPVHHATGIWVSFFPFLQAGACIEFKSGSFDPRWTWDRWKKGGLTYFSGVPTIYMRMMRYYQEHLTKLSAGELGLYSNAPSQFKAAICGTSALPKPISDFWTALMNGRRIVQRYGATEIGVVFNMPLDGHDDIPDGSVGQATVGVDVKLSNGDEGEILVRSFNMFSKYLHDPDATRNAHDIEGYFRSGDLALRKGNCYFIQGRASVDIIKSGGYKISALDVEREMLALPYVSEVMVVGVTDEEFGQRVAALVSLRSDQVAEKFFSGHGRKPDELKLDDLRTDLRERLAGYKLPTLLRVVEGEFPKRLQAKLLRKVWGRDISQRTIIKFQPCKSGRIRIKARAL